MGGKKGKMTAYGSAHEKWRGTEYLRELPSAVSYARKFSRDEAAINAKKLRDELLHRKTRTYCLLNTLINDRLSDDVREDSGDRKWIHSLTSQTFKTQKRNQEKHYNIEKVRAASLILESLTPQHKVGHVPSLLEICTNVVAVNLAFFETESLHGVFCNLPPKMTEMLSLLGTQYQTIDDSNIECLSNTSAEFLILRETITDTGIARLIHSTIETLHRSDDDEAEDWWESTLDSTGKFFNSVRLSKLVLLGCDITIQGLSQMRLHFDNIEILIVHGVNFNMDSTTSLSTFPKQFCKMFSGWMSLTELHISFCPWLTIDTLETLIGRIRSTRDNFCSDLGNLQKVEFEEGFSPVLIRIGKIVVAGLYDIESIAAERGLEVIEKFRFFCNIDLVIAH